MISDSDRAILEFEVQHPNVTAARSDLIRTRLRMTDTRYVQRLFALVHLPEVVEEWPQMARRVQEQMREKVEARAARTP